MTEAAHTLAPPNLANPKPFCVCGQPWPCAGDVTDPVTARLAEMVTRYRAAAASPSSGRQACAASADDVPFLLAAVERAMDVAAKHEHEALRWQDPLPVPSWIPELREVILAELPLKGTDDA